MKKNKTENSQLTSHFLAAVLALKKRNSRERVKENPANICQ